MDIGTGTGLISLMLAQRSDIALIDAIEIDQNAHDQAKLNFISSPWSERINSFNSSLQDFETVQKYDLIVSNPPFFENSIKNECSKKSMARHTDSLSYEELISKSASLLNEKGVISIIYPYMMDDKISILALNNHFSFVRKTVVFGNAQGKPIRVLAEMCFSGNNSVPFIEDSLIIENSRHNYTDQYIELTKDFYLKM